MTTPRAFSLLEAMVTVAIVGIAAAIALPSILPLRAQASLTGSADQLAAVLARARLEAMVQKRCSRVRVVDGVVVVEVLASFDCETTPLRGPFLPPAVQAWNEVTRVTPGTDTTYTLDRAPPTGPGGEAGEVRFRPTGRVFGQDEDFTNDFALFTATGTAGKSQVLVQGNGLVCRLGGKAPVATLAGPECP